MAGRIATTVLLLGLVAGFAAVEPSRAEGFSETLPFELGEWTSLDLKEGPVTLHRLQIREAEGALTKSRLLRPGRNSAYIQDIEIRIEYSNEATRDWKARIDIEWIDRDGRTIDGYGSKENLDEGDRYDMLTARQSTLRYGLDRAEKVRIRIEVAPD